MAITAINAQPRPLTTNTPDSQVTGMPGVPKPQAPYDDRFEMTPKLRVTGFFRTLRLAPKELVGGHTIAQPYFAKTWQRVLHAIFPGGLIESSFATVKPNAAAEAIPTGPSRYPVDARAWMPNVRFERGEEAFPIDPGFDGDGDVSNNREHYRPRQLDGNQEPTYYVHARQKGEYTVVQYWAYHAYNKFLNYHKNDMEMFSVYLQPDAKGQLRPAFLQTDWHGTMTMTPWTELKLDARGRPMVTVDRGSHECRPLRLQDKLPKGLTLLPQGFVQDDKGIRPVTVHLKGDDPQVHGQEPVTPLKPGLDPRDAWYPGVNWIAGFKVNVVAVAGGARARALWFNPAHPAAFGLTGTTGQVAPLVAAGRR